MSQENVEIVRHNTEALLRGDLDAAFENVDPEVEWEEAASLGPDASVYRGIDEARKALGSWFGMWRDYESEAVEYIDAGDEVVVLSRERALGRSGVTVERDVGTVTTVRDGQIVRVRLFASWDEAREAAGLQE